MPVENIDPTRIDYRHELPRAQSIEDLDRRDVLERVREAAASPSVLTHFLQDPEVFQSVARSKHKRSRQVSSDSPSRKFSTSKSTVLRLVIKEEERQSNDLKAVLRSTGERLEYEIRRANEAESRAVYAEVLAREAVAKSHVLESTSHRTDVELMTLRDEIHKYKAQLDSAEVERNRIQDYIRQLERQRRDAEESAARAKNEARAYQLELRKYQAREEGFEEGKKIGMQRWYIKGKELGWKVGHLKGLEEGKSDGYENGIRAGKEAGLEEGKEQGRAEERENAIRAFDRFLAMEMDENDDSRLERTRRWANSIYPAAMSRVQSYASESLQAALQRRVYTDSDSSNDSQRQTNDRLNY